MQTCASCGQENPEGFAYCGACGAPLATEERRETRKTVTVVFSDLTGSTKLGEQLDPESLRRVMSRYYDEMKAVVERHGGTVEKFIGDAVMAVFGIPVLNEDDALRAVRAAAEMREALEALNEELERDWGVRIQMRTGVNTGEVVAGDGTGSQRFAVGDAVNVAKRFEEAAPPGGILLGEPTYRLVRDAVAVEAVESLDVKGKSEALNAYRLLSIEKDAPGRARHLDSPMVGRERERSALEQAYERAVEERSCHLFTVLGAAGVGKSRLIAEFLAGLGGEATVMRGRCLPYGEGITFWPLLEAIRGLYGDDVASAVRSQLEGDESAEMISHRIAAAVGLEANAGSSDETFWAVRKLLESLAQDRPAVVVFDDLQWGEPTFHDLVEHLADWARDAPILVVCLARPELLDERPGWAGGKFNATSVLLERLSPVEATELVANLLGKAQLAEEVQTKITDAAEGNPLFVEEMLAMLIDDGLLARENGDWVVTGDLSSLTVPPTIHALISARLDRLGRDERAVIERGSVEGKVFHRGAVAELSAGEGREGVPRHLQALVRKELIRPDRTDLPGEDAFRFRHLLIRDAAYDSMPKELRADLHERFASWLERIGGLHVAEFDEIVGYHLEQAYGYRTELAPMDDAARELAQQAGERLAAGAGRAMERVDVPATIGLAQRALDLLPNDHELRPRLLSELGLSLKEVGRLEEARTVFEAGLAASAETGDAVTRALTEARMAGLETMLGGSMEKAASDLKRVADELEELGDERGLAEVLSLLGQLSGWSVQEGMGRASLERGAAIARKHGDLRLESACLGWLAIHAFWGPGPIDEGLRICAEMLDRPGISPASCPHLLVIKGLLKRMAGLDAEGDADIAVGDALMREFGRTVDADAFSMGQVCVSVLAGRFVEAEERQAPALEALRAYGEAGYLSSATALSALALCGQGRYAEAEPLVRESKELGAEDDLTTQTYWRAAYAQILAARGEVEEALACAQEAVDLATPRRSIDLAIAALSAAEVSRAGGRTDEARRLLTEALQISQQKGNVPGVAWAEQQISELDAAQSP